MRRISGSNQFLSVVLVFLLFAGCASNAAFRNAELALKNKNWDVAVAEYSRALAQDPNNAEIKLKLGMAKLFASRSHYEEAKRMEDAKKLQEAVMELEVAVDLDPDNKSASEELDRLQRAIEHPEMVQSQQEPREHPLSELPSVALEPEFSPKKDVPIELKFKDTSIRELLTTLGKIGDVNILFDNDFKDVPVSFDFTNTTFLQALDTVLSSSHNFYKVIGRNTLIIAPDRPEKRAEYEETVSRTFYLSSAEVEEVARTLRNVLGIQMIATNVRLNSVTVKDRITRVMAAEKLVAQVDKPKPEIVVDVEILEVSRTRFQEYGIQVNSPNTQGVSTTVFTKPDNLSIDPGPIVSKSNFFISNFPQATLKLLKQSNDSKVLASLPLRSVTGETGRVRFGRQVPVPQTTFAPIATGGVNQQPITSFIYRDVGINIDVTPRVHRDGDITLELIIESSSIAGTGFGNLPEFSTSRVEKTLRLREGETSIVAGLIRDEEQKSQNGLPVLSQIPVLGKLFSDNTTSIKESDVVIALSPHIIRSLKITPEDEKMLWLGIEEQQQGAGYRYTPIPSVPPAYEEPQPEEEQPQQQQHRKPNDLQNQNENNNQNSEEDTGDVPPEDTEESPPHHFH